MSESIVQGERNKYALMKCLVSSCNNMGVHCFRLKETDHRDGSSSAHIIF